MLGPHHLLKEPFCCGNIPFSAEHKLDYRCSRCSFRLLSATSSCYVCNTATQFTKPEFVERMYLLVGMALLLWTSIGRAVEESEPKVRLESKTKGARLSLVRVGSYYWQQMSKRVRLTTQFVREHLPPPCLRMFKWLMAPQK